MQADHPRPDIQQQAAGLVEELAGAPGPRLLVTGGPTAEDIDDVRFITNRSSGRMGIALAEAAVERGWPCLLVLGPTPDAPPAAAKCLRVRSARDMRDAVMAAFRWCDALAMAAAVADYTPAAPVSGKLRKQPGDLLLRLVRTPDILAELAVHPDRQRKVVAGFSLGASIEVEEARRKLIAKDMDVVIANSVQTFASRDIAARLIRRDGSQADFPGVSKQAMAEGIIDEIAALVAARNRG